MLLEMKQSFIPILAILFFASCAGDDAAPYGRDPWVSEIPVSMEPLSVGSVTRGEGDLPEIEDLTAGNGFQDGESLLYISQMGTNIDPDFQGETSNRYVYVYKENPDASWNASGTYNFYSRTDDAPIAWGGIRDRGPVGNAFSLYALYFPCANEVRFDVEKDQRELKKFRESDIMGAYHATSSLYTRLRFRLYHLMVYLHVTLYVPDYDSAKKTGFVEDALRNAAVENAYSDFEIEWRANRSSDTDAPYVDIPQNAQKTEHIHMFRHEPDAEVREIQVQDYYGEGSLTMDRVRTYNFSVLIPPQIFGSENKDRFLRFQLTPVGTDPDNPNVSTYKNYYFSANQLMTGETLHLTQGTLQHLSLYVPRTGDDIILVGADIIDWSDASSDMTVTEQPKTEQP